MPGLLEENITHGKAAHARTPDLLETEGKLWKRWHESRERKITKSPRLALRSLRAVDGLKEKEK